MATKLRYSIKNKSIKIFSISNELQDLLMAKNLDFDKKNNIVLLTRKNADIVEELIKNDDNYYPFSETLFKSFGVQNVTTNKNRSLFAVAREIDRDNNTNVWRYKKNRVGFQRVINYMKDPNNKFFLSMQSTNENIYIELPELLIAAGGTGLNSLSSKLCKYLCEFCGYGDKFYINDSVVRNALLFYLDYYDANKLLSDGKTEAKSSNQLDKLSYKELFNLLRKLHNARDQRHNDGKISKSELDHIIWYCYKSF